MSHVLDSGVLELEDLVFSLFDSLLFVYLIKFPQESHVFSFFPISNDKLFPGQIQAEHLITNFHYGTFISILAEIINLVGQIPVHHLF